MALKRPGGGGRCRCIISASWTVAAARGSSSENPSQSERHESTAGSAVTGLSAVWGVKGVRLAQNIPVGPRIPVGIQLYKAGPTSGPTGCLSHLMQLSKQQQQRRELGGPPLRVLQPEQARASLLRLAHCPGRKPPFLAAKRPARPYKSAIQNRFTVGNAEGA
jgi:hypothetical protein